MSDRVCCQCEACRVYVYEDNFGNEHFGRLVAQSTRRRHRQLDSSRTLEATESKSTAREAQCFNSEPSSHQPESLNAAAPAISATTWMQVNALVLGLVVWLNVCCGLSRHGASLALKVYRTVIVLIGTSLFPDFELPSNILPQDVRTAYKSLNLEPKLIRYVCCPQCFARYHFDSCPEYCIRRESLKSRPCGANMWRNRHGSADGKIAVPQRLYSTQDMSDWLSWFVCQTDIESALDSSAGRRAAVPVMRDLWDSPAWQALGDYTHQRGNLVFGMFVDWFNPYSNKQSGKTASVGLIYLCCFSLPPSMRLAIRNIFFVGLTPGPKEPTVLTVANVIEPLVQDLLRLYGGVMLSTPSSPNGRLWRCALLPEIYDVVAMRKVGALASHASSKNFCSFCHAKLSDIENLDTSFPLRSGHIVIQQATQWLDARTQVARKQLFAQNGVRWTPLHRLPYRNPVRHSLLGVLHNWMLGVLQHHGRVRWGLDLVDDGGGVIRTALSSASEVGSDTADLEAEIQDLQLESQSYSDVPIGSRRGHRAGSPRMTTMSSGEETGDDDYLQPDSDPESDTASDVVDVATSGSVAFSKTYLALWRKGLEEWITPTWLERPPNNLGEKRHGKLKADLWHTLFAYTVPLILLEAWWPLSYDSVKNQLLRNTVDLVVCTHIMGSYTTTDADADRFQETYTTYRRTLASLFPAKSVPNHHYASHNPDLLKFWGPMMSLSEFHGERMIGILQQISTNSHIYDLDYTLLRQICRRGRLESRLSEGANSNLAELGDLLGYAKAQASLSGDSRPPAVRMPIEAYTLLLAHLRRTHPSLRHANRLPHPKNSLVLSPWADQERHLQLDGRTFSVAQFPEGNSSVIWRDGQGFYRFGNIVQIWRHRFQSLPRYFIFIVPRPSLRESDRQMVPFCHLPDLQTRVFYASSSLDTLVIAEPDQIVSHAATRKRPAGTFGISSETVVAINLDRGKHGIYALQW